MPAEKINKDLGKGIMTIPSDAELILPSAAQDSLGWISTDGMIELCRGRLLIGADDTTSGYVQGDGWGYKADGTSVHFRKTNTKIQYYNTATSLWVDVVTGLTNGAEYTFAHFISTAGTFIYATGIDGIFKFHTASLPSYIQLYGSTDIYRGKSIITDLRMIMWGLPTNKSSLYGSRQDISELGTGYTTVSAEAITGTSGTLAFKAGDGKRNCFLTVFTITSTGEIFNDKQTGILTGSLGGTGTINYITGAWTLSTNLAGTCTYRWEMSNTKGVTDFSYSATRLPGEGFILNQSEGGDIIQNLEVQDGKIYSLKDRSAYELFYEITSATNENFSNKVFRRDIGIPYWRASVSTSKGIIFMNTSNIDTPQLTILQKNLNGDNLEPVTLAKHFDFSKYFWDMCVMETYGESVVFSGRTPDSAINNKLFLYNTRKETIDILPYSAKTITTNNGYLYIGDTISFNIYNILSGFDDDEFTIENYWISNDEKYNSEVLKKLKRLRLKGLITSEQKLEVYISYDNDEFTLVGTILGNGKYVDFTETYSIGTIGIGSAILGGEDDYIDGASFLCELKIPGPKFRKRKIKLVSTGVGYVSVNMIDDFNIKTFANKLPNKYRLKQNVSLDGTLVNQ